MEGVIIQIAPDRKITVRPLEPGERPKWWGYYWSLTSEIALDATGTPAQQADTLLHECIHALWDHRKMGKRVSEETVAAHIGEGLAMLFGSNPHILHAIAGALNHGVPIFQPKEN